ncbi:MAG: phosphatase PAP2 family protein [Xanthobacteraceae bacterium]|jgi:lipid A 4'-phosphatase
MNRTGLVIALTIGVAVGVVFGVWPRLDLAASTPFYDPRIHDFPLNAHVWSQNARDAARGLIALLILPAGIALVGKILFPRRPLLIKCQAALFLIGTLAIGPGLITNTLLKDHWGRARPIDVTEFGGASRFTAWWDPRGDCPNNCSFIAGEPAGAFWTLAPAALAPPQWRALAYGAALAFGSAVGLLRIAGGGHFFTDVVFAGVFMYLLIWAAYLLIYRWWPNRASNKTDNAPE